MGYQKSEQGKQTLFECTPENLPESSAFIKGSLFTGRSIFPYIGYFIVAVIVQAILGAILRPMLSGFGNIIAGLVGLVVLYTLIKRRIKRGPKKPVEMLHRDRTQFSVSAEGISLNGKLFPARDIHRIVCRNHILERLESTGQIVTVNTGNLGSSLSSQSRAAGQQMGIAHMKGIAAVSYRVEFEAGGVSHILAGGLSDAGSFAVMTDVNRALGFAS